MHMLHLEPNTSSRSAMIATKSLNVAQIDAYYIQVHNQIDSIKKYKLNADLNTKEKEEQLADLKRVNELLNETNSKLKSDNERLRASLEQDELFKSEAYNKIDMLQSALALVKEHVKQVKQRIDSFEETNRISLKEKQDGLRVIADLSDKLDKTGQLVSDKDQLLDESRGRIDELTRESSSKSELISEFECKIDQLVANMRDKDEALSQNETLIRNLTEKNAGLEENLNQFKLEFNEEKINLEKLIENLNQIRSDLTRENDELKSELTSLSEEIKSVNEIRSKLSVDLDRLKQENELKLNEMTSLLEENKLIRSDLNELIRKSREDLLEQTEMNTHLRSDLDKANQLLNEKTNLVDELRLEIASLNRDKSSLEIRFRDESARTSDLCKQVADLVGDHSGEDISLLIVRFKQDYELVIANLKESLSDKQENLDQLNDVNCLLKSDLDEAHEQVDKRKLFF